MTTLIPQSYGLAIGFRFTNEKRGKVQKQEASLVSAVQRSLFENPRKRGEGYADWTIRVVNQVLRGLRLPRGVFLATLIITWFTGPNRDGNVVVKVDCLAGKAIKS